VKIGSRSYALSCVHPEKPLVARSVTPQEVVVVDWEQQREVGRFRGKVGTVAALALHPDGQTVAVAGEDARVEVWNAATGVLLSSAEQKTTGMRFSADGAVLLLGQPGQLVGYNWADKQGLWKREEPAFLNPALLTVHPNGLCAWSAMGAPHLEVLDVVTGETRHRWQTRDEFMALQFHPDGERIATSINTLRSPLLHQFAMWRIGKEEPEKEFPIPAISISVAVSPKGGTIATGDSRGVQLWDFASGAPEARLAPRTQTKVKDFGTVESASAFLVSTIRFLEDGQTLVSDGDSFCHWQLSDKSAIWSYPPAKA
jgi:WD40 repeat protein